ncbi:MAG: DUF2804 domain-containing protein [Candidatus Hydrogenedentes bacterium]|nr:DUF2804 domain-containing protein [Candidatus Hydrogenedentota bacterium]
MKDPRIELIAPVDLCLPNGQLNPEAVGWSRHPLHRCNLRGRFLRKKRWHYWCVTSPSIILAVTVANVDYAALGQVYVLDPVTLRFAERTAFRPFGRLRLPESPAGDVEYRHGGLEVLMHQSATGMALRLHSPWLMARPFTAHIEVALPPEQETLNVVVPWDARTFQFTSKQVGLAATGEIQWGHERFALQAPDAYACLDFGRGIWPYQTRWNWGAFACRSGGRTLGVNLGGQWTDGTGATENGVCIDGRLHKIHEDVRFICDLNNVMAPWRIESVGTESVRLNLTPFYDRHVEEDRGILKSMVHQMFGHFSGTVSVDHEIFTIDHALGWAEEHHARW